MIFDELFWVTAALGMFSALTNVLAANIYDVQQIKRCAAKPPRRRPLISVIVYAQNNEALISDCLDSLLASHLRNLEIIVVDDASGDGTVRQVRQCINKKPRQQIKLYAKRRPAGRTQAVQEAFKKYANGDFILLFEQPAHMDSEGLQRARSYFNGSWDVLLLNSKLVPAYKASALFQEFWLLIQNRSNKARAVLGSTASKSTFAPVICRRETLLSYLNGRHLTQLKQNYASDVVVYSPAGPFLQVAEKSYQKQAGRWRQLVATEPEDRHIQQIVPILLSLSSLLVGLAMPPLLTYFAYLAIHLHEPDFLVVSWVGLALYLLFAIWEDEQLRLSQKLKYALLMPVTYVWFYFMSLTHYLVVLTSVRGALRFRRV